MRQLRTGAHATHDEDDSAEVISAGVETALSRDSVTVLPATDVTFSG